MAETKKFRFKLKRMIKEKIALKNCSKKYINWKKI